MTFTVDDVPQRLVEVLIEQDGERDARTWLETLPSRVQRCRDRWKFDVIQIQAASNRTFVTKVQMHDGTFAALKVVPGSQSPFGQIAKFGETGAGPKLLAHDRWRNAGLMEWIDGETFPTCRDSPLYSLCGDVGDLLVRTTAVMAADDAVPLSRWVPQAAQTAKRRLKNADLFDVSLLDADVNFLLQFDEPNLLHGDVVPPNLMMQPDGTLRIIDPDPFAGPPEVDFADFCHRAERGENTVNYVERICGMFPHLRVPLLERYVLFASRTYVAYRHALQRGNTDGHLALASVTEALRWL